MIHVIAAVIQSPRAGVLKGQSSPGGISLSLPCGEEKDKNPRVKHWETIADNLSKAVGVGAAYQPWILAGERSLLQTPIAVRESGSLCHGDEKLTAFLELQRAIHELAVSATNREGVNQGSA